MHLTFGLNERGTQVALGLNPFRSQTSAAVGLLCICTDVTAVSISGFVTENKKVLGLKDSLDVCVDCPCTDTIEPFVSSGIDPQADPVTVPRPQTRGKQHTPGGREREAFTPSGLDPQADPLHLTSPAESRGEWCVPAEQEWDQYESLGLDPQGDPTPVPHPKRTK